MAPRKKKAKRKRGPNGRPPKLTPQLQEEICGHIAQGCSYEDACTLCMIGRETLRRWRKAGEAGANYGRLSKAYMTRFWGNVQYAEACAKAGAVKAWHMMSQTDWKAAQALLAIRYPDEWSKRALIDLTSDGHALQTVQVFSPREDLAELLGDGKGEKG